MSNLSESQPGDSTSNARIPESSSINNRSNTRSDATRPLYQSEGVQRDQSLTQPPLPKGPKPNSSAPTKPYSRFNASNMFGSIGKLLGVRPSNNQHSEPQPRDSASTLRDSSASISLDPPQSHDILPSAPALELFEPQPPVNTITRAAMPTDSSLTLEEYYARLSVTDNGPRPSVAPFYIPPNKNVKDKVNVKLEEGAGKHATSREQLKEKPERKQPPILPESTKDTQSNPWLQGPQIECTSLNAPLSSCVTLTNIDGGPETSLVIADLSFSPTLSTTIKTINASARKTANHQLPSLVPAALVHIYPDTNIPRIPVLALASGPDVYLYHAHTPFQRFTLPFLPPHAEEAAIWRDLELALESAVLDVKQFLSNPGTGVDESLIHFSWNSLHDMSTLGIKLTRRSNEFLKLTEVKDRRAFIARECSTSDLAHVSEISCMTVIPRSSLKEDAPGLLVIGTEDGWVYIVSPPVYLIVDKWFVGQGISGIAAVGVYERDWCLGIIGRGNGFYGVTRNGMKRLAVLEHSMLGIISSPQGFVIACINRTILFYSLSEGKFKHSLKMPAPIHYIEPILQVEKKFHGFSVSLSNGEVRVYRGQDLVSCITSSEPIYAIKFGAFGRDPGSLVLMTSSGALDVRILRRHADLSKLPIVTKQKPDPKPDLFIPKKTRLYLDIVKNERENAPEIFRSLENDLQRLRFLASNTLSSLRPKNVTPACPIKLNAYAKGMGPTWRIYATISNTGTETWPETILLLSPAENHEKWRIDKARISIGPLKAGKVDERSTLVHWIGEWLDGGGVFNVRLGEGDKAIGARILEEMKVVLIMEYF